MEQKKLIKATLAELLGMTLFVYIGTGAAVSTGRFRDDVSFGVMSDSTAVSFFVQASPLDSRSLSLSHSYTIFIRYLHSFH